MKSPVSHIFFRRLRTALTGLLALQLYMCALAAPSRAQVPCLAGFVRDSGGAPVVNADLDFDNALTGQRLITPGDNTDANGFYSVCVLPGLYHISFAPPPGTRLLGQRFTNVSLQSSLELNVTLQSGVVISGVITDSVGNPIGGVDLDVDVVGGERVYTPGDNSDSLTGAYRIVAPPGLLRISYEPLPGDPWIAQRIDSVLIVSDTVIDLTLKSGVSLSGILSDQSGGSAANVDIGLRDVTTGAKVFLANNRTDSLGAYSVVANAGLYTAQFSPPPGSRLIGVQLDTIALNSDTTIDLTLVDGHLVNITVIDSEFISQVGADVDVTDELTRDRLFLPYDRTDSAGSAQVVVPTGTFEIKADPPPGGILDRVIVRNVPIAADTSLTLVLPIREVVISGFVVDNTGVGIADVTIGASSGIDGSLLKVRRGTTAADGSYTASVPLIANSVWFSPPRGSHYRGTKVEGLALTVDTAWAPVTLLEGVLVTVIVMDRDLNPFTGGSVGVFATSGAAVFQPHDSIAVDGTALITVAPGSYRITAASPDGSEVAELTNVSLANDTTFTMIVGAGAATRSFALMQNYPNPFNSTTRIPFSLLSPGAVRLEIFNVLGQRVRNIDLGVTPSGYREVVWQAHNDDGTPVASGVYFYRLITPYGVATRSLIVLQ